jgi:hypothetical protein
MRHLRLVHSIPPAPAESEPNPSDRRPFEPAVEALLQHVRIIGPLPRAVRERALARARAALTAPACAMTRPAIHPRRPSRAIHTVHPRRPWLTLLVSLTLVAAIGAAVEAFLSRGSADTQQPPPAAAPLRLAAE